VGEIKRHFRDKTWSLLVPQRLKGLGAAVEQARTELTHKLGQAPTPAQIAEELNLTLDEVIEAMESQAAYSTVSLDGSANEDAQSLGDTIGELDAALENIEDRESLKPLLAMLDDRSKQILVMRFFDNLSQSAIASELGLSQMHVSRILTKTLNTLREGLSN
jgi:RNA polymerase sigma-B factor